MIRPGTSVSKHIRNAPLSKMQILYGQNKHSSNYSNKEIDTQIPSAETFINLNDWTGAIAVLELDKFSKSKETLPWLAYCYFHNGDYKRALSIYRDFAKKYPLMPMILEQSLCLFGLFKYQESQALAEKAEDSPLKARILYQCAQKLDNDSALMSAHRKLGSSVEDRLSVAAIHLQRSHLDDSVDIYKKIMLENRNYKALNYYLALCYYKQELYDVAEEVLGEYLKHFPTSVLGNNLAAAIQFQLNSEMQAKEVLKKLQKNYEGADLTSQYDSLSHNQCVFNGGENALKVFPPLVEIFPEAKLNLVIYHLKQKNWQDAYKLVSDLEPRNPKEYALKGVVCAAYGQEVDNSEILLQAQHDFQTVGKRRVWADNRHEQHRMRYDHGQAVLGLVFLFEGKI